MVFLEEGRVIEEASTEELFDNPKEERTKVFLSHIL